MEVHKLKGFIQKLIWLVAKIVFAGAICFFLSRLIPSSYMEDQLDFAGSNLKTENPVLWNNTIEEYREKRGLNFPLFYWSVRPYYRRSFDPQKTALHQNDHINSLLKESKNIEGIRTYSGFLQQLESLIAEENNSQHRKTLIKDWSALIDARSLKHWKSIINRMKLGAHYSETALADIELDQVNLAFWQFLPSFKWNGAENQFHLWVLQYLSGDWGSSVVDGRSVLNKITKGLKWTLSISIIALVLSLLMSIWTGFVSGLKKNTVLSSVFNALAMFIFAAPVFWIATLFIQWLTTVGFFPVFSSVARPISDLSFFGAIHHYTLPILVLTLGIWAFLHRQFSEKVEEVNRQEFILAAKMRLISDRVIQWKYILPNALFPIITALTVIIPALMGGSLIVELIFDIPGLGKLFYDSLLKQDWNTVIPIVYVNILIIIFSNLIAEFLYRWIDPRISFYEKNIQVK